MVAAYQPYQFRLCRSFGGPSAGSAILGLGKRTSDSRRRCVSVRAMIVNEFGAPEQMVVEEVPAPEPGPDEVLIEARAIGVNFPDLMVIEGSYQILPEPPFSPGKEVAGVVRAVGSEVSGLKVGARVMAQVEYGAYREQVLAAEAHTTALPDNISFEEGAAFGLAYLTVYFALVRRAQLQSGETVLVTGGVGGEGNSGGQHGGETRPRA